VKILPARETIEALEKRARECEEKAQSASESLARGLREKATLLREWAAALKNKKWMS
jgi:hypothetical protein